MAIFQLEIVDEDVQRVFDAVCGSYGWLAELPNPDYVEGGEAPKTIPNPETQGDFTHRKVREYLSEIVAAALLCAGGTFGYKQHDLEQQRTSSLLFPVSKWQSRC